MNTSSSVPQGDIVLRAMAMPADTNPNGTIFGGWLMSQIDLGGAILAREIAVGKVATIKVNDLTFLKPVSVGDVVSCHAYCVRTGNRSITVNVALWVRKIPLDLVFCVAEALLTYVAVDDFGKSRFLPVENRLLHENTAQLR